MCCTVVLLVLSSVTSCPAMAAIQLENQVALEQDQYAAEMEELTQDGTPVDLAQLSNLSVLKKAQVAGIDVTVSTPGAATQDVSEGVFTVHTAPLLPEAEQQARSTLENSGVLRDPSVEFFVQNLTQVGYVYAGSGVTTSVSKIKVTDRSNPSPSDLAKMGVSWSLDEPDTLIAHSTITNLTYSYPETHTKVDVAVIQRTTLAGSPVGSPIVAVKPVTLDSANSDEFQTFKTLAALGSLGAGVGAAAVLVVYAAAYGPAGWGLILCAGVAVGVVVFLAVLGVLVIVWALWHVVSGPSTSAYFQIAPDPPSKTALHNTDGVIVYDDGAVQFMVPPLPPLPPTTGSRWVAATRTASLTQNGELWVLNDNQQWSKYPSASTYTALAASGSWFATITTNAAGTTYLEIPDGPAQPTNNAKIRSDVSMLNKGIDPATSKKIDPPVPGWKEFVPGVETTWEGPYGLALATDGRVFGVGSNRDGQCNLPGRYTHVATSISVGRFSASVYSLGIRASDGGLDFAGDNWFSIKDAITSARLTNVRDVAAGPDRAIAITQAGGTWVLGKNTDWHSTFTGPSNTKSGSYTSISSTLPTDEGNVGVFIATTGPETQETGRAITRTPSRVIAKTPLNAPVSTPELLQWRAEEVGANPRPAASPQVWGDPTSDSTLDPIVGYGMKIDAAGHIHQFIGRAAAESDVAPIHAMLTAWDKGPSKLDEYLDKTYPLDPNYAAQHFDLVHAVTHEPDSMTTVWSATTVSSVAPYGLVVGHYSLDQRISNKNWSIYALETDVMPIPGVQAFSSGYITKQATITHNWTGDFAKYNGMYNLPYESITGVYTHDGSLVLSENTDYHHLYTQSPATITSLAGFIPVGGSTTNLASWSQGYTSTDPSGSRGTFNPASVVAVKMPSTRPSLTSPLMLASIECDAAFTNAGIVGAHIPHDSLPLLVLGCASS